MPRLLEKALTTGDRKALIKALKESRLNSTARDRERAEERDRLDALLKKRETIKRKVEKRLKALGRDLLVLMQDYGREKGGCRLDLLDNEREKGKCPTVFSVAWEAEKVEGSTAQDLASSVIGLLNLKIKTDEQ